MNDFALLAIFLGGGLGATLRYSLSLVLAGPQSNAFPYPTLVINLLGALAIGIITELFALKFHATPAVRLFLVTGVLGGFTTYSAFALESVMLIERGAWMNLAIYVGASALGTIALALLGIVAVRQVMA